MSHRVSFVLNCHGNFQHPNEFTADHIKAIKQDSTGAAIAWLAEQLPQKEPYDGDEIICGGGDMVPITFATLRSLDIQIDNDHLIHVTRQDIRDRISALISGEQRKTPIMNAHQFIQARSFGFKGDLLTAREGHNLQKAYSQIFMSQKSFAPTTFPSQRHAPAPVFAEAVRPARAEPRRTFEISPELAAHLEAIRLAPDYGVS